MHSHCNIWMPNRISLGGGDGARLNAKILLREIKEQIEKEERERERERAR